MPKQGEESYCRSCKNEIIYDNGIWYHKDNNPRHPAVPYDLEKRRVALRHTVHELLSIIFNVKESKQAKVHDLMYRIIDALLPDEPEKEPAENINPNVFSRATCSGCNKKFDYIDADDINIGSCHLILCGKCFAKLRNYFKNRFEYEA